MEKYVQIDNQKDKLLDMGKVQEQLPLSMARLYQLVHEGSLPAIQVGRRLMVATADLEEFIKAHRRS
jgi:excisionase family DNA binding protein